MRFSLRWLFGLVSFVAVASASLLYASEFLSDVLAAALVAFLVWAMIGARYGQKTTAAFCGGCAIAGWVYLLRLWLPSGYLLPTSAADRAMEHLYSAVSREVRAEPINGDLTGAYYVNGFPYIRRPMWKPFAKTGQCLTAFVVAILGGIVGRLFYRE